MRSQNGTILFVSSFLFNLYFWLLLCEKSDERANIASKEGELVKRNTGMQVSVTSKNANGSFVKLSFISLKFITCQIL